MTSDDARLRVTTWRKSSYSGASNGDCIEMGVGVPSAVPVRDSKDPHGPALAFDAAAWSAFVAGIKAGEFGA
ncbi:DUF397 domain-containing protein [Streptomyces zagrosensis]|uniref:DUF397 domain-containing protein n=1 Tax=Streptomyces zagrosensis TaxID=1042984 RepID=A0A7W9UX73_9ACTN|nr:DUF397 domain-containing protein [Streptomyces zagrosensis]MBB5934593.1 hypothetical protein [Streptomyces zagrosensis]